MSAPALARYAVFGHPIAHSKSPRIHAEFARRTHQSLSYEAIEAPLTDFSGCVRRFIAAGGVGGNVTVPFKEEAFALCAELSARARAAEAVNTLVFRADGSWYGDNTDGIGLVRDLNARQVVLERARILVCGAGGAVRGILGPLLDAGPAELVIANRSHHKALLLARAFAGQGEVRAATFEQLPGERFDLVLNATSAGLSGALPALPAGLFAPGAVAYDLVYGPAALPFLRWARAEGAAQLIDGVGMLIEQAAEAFFLWRGVRPETQGMAALLGVMAPTL